MEMLYFLMNLGCFYSSWIRTEQSIWKLQARLEFENGAQEGISIFWGLKYWVSDSSKTEEKKYWQIELCSGWFSCVYPEHAASASCCLVLHAQPQQNKAPKLLGSLVEQCLISLLKDSALKVIQENILQAGNRHRMHMNAFLDEFLDACEEPINFCLCLNRDCLCFRVFKQTTPSANGGKLWQDFAWQYASILSRFYTTNPFFDMEWKITAEL